jgi:hypothetical protein
VAALGTLQARGGKIMKRMTQSKWLNVWSRVLALFLTTWGAAMVIDAMVGGAK